MKTGLPAGLRLTFTMGAVISSVIAVACMLFPAEVAKFTGLNQDGFTLPVFQQSGAAVLGYALAALLSLRATRWEEVRIAVLGSLAFAAFSTAGAFYYVVLQGVATTGLVLLLIYSLLLTVGLGYYVVRPPAHA
ncbi:MAG TPA: hypothetical protein VJG32_14630 [Anaerolineae bacterium]|nr:hypothetical protein [Anaerolineae bacterium]